MQDLVPQSGIDKWERVRKAAVARAERADGTRSEVRMGPSAGPCCIGPGEDFVFIWRVLGSQGRVSHREVLLRSVRWSHWCGEFSSGCERWLGGRVGAAGRRKGTAWWAGGEEIRHQEFKQLLRLVFRILWLLTAEAPWSGLSQEGGVYLKETKVAEMVLDFAIKQDQKLAEWRIQDFYSLSLSLSLSPPPSPLYFFMCLFI